MLTPVLVLHLSYNLTLASLHKALALCEEHGVKHQRPEDYYAEMVKTDDHMLKLKDHLLAEKRRKEERVKTVKERQMKKFAKKVRPHFSSRFFHRTFNSCLSTAVHMMIFKTMGISDRKSVV